MVHIAYFSMEIGTSKHIPTYSGGLGILAGDTLKSYADIGLPVVALTLLNEKGYFKQRIDDEGNQHEEPVEWNPKERMEVLPNTIIVHLEGREVKVRAWKQVIEGNAGHQVPIYYLDTNIEGNTDFDRTLTSHLYGGDRYYRLCQETILGVGGVRMLESLGYHEIKKYHMNEGHAALLGVELLKKTYEQSEENLVELRKKCVFTTHTPVAAGHDRFEHDLVRKVLGDFIPDFIIAKASDKEKFNMTLLGLTFSGSINGVAKRHGEVSRSMFPHFHITSITNGVHPHTWTSDATQELLNKHIPGWDKDPYSLRSVLSIPANELLSTHDTAKQDLINTVNEKTGQDFKVDVFTIGFARRFTPYKRPDLLLFNLERLKTIAEKIGGIQVVFAGKSHPNDGMGKDIMKHVINTCKEVNAWGGNLRMVFLEGYDMHLGKLMTSGCDIWLNTPQRPYEASGTSGMKAALNGVPHVSTVDGWWVEGHIEGLTGWSLGPRPGEPGFDNDATPDDEANDLYTKLETQILPTYYHDKEAWAKIMKHCIAINGSFFNTYRMAQQYVASAYTDS